MLNTLRNICAIGIRDAIFWEGVSPGKEATIHSVRGHIRCCDRLMQRAMMLGKPEAYAAQGARRERLAKILNKLEK